MSPLIPVSRSAEEHQASDLLSPDKGVSARVKPGIRHHKLCHLPVWFS